MTPENDKSSMPPEIAKPVSRGFAWQKFGFFLALLALLLSGGQWLETRQKLNDAQQEMARRLAEADVGQKEDRGAQKELREQIEDLQAKLGAVEGKLNEFEGQSATLETLYQDIARDLVQRRHRLLPAGRARPARPDAPRRPAPAPRQGLGPQPGGLPRRVAPGPREDPRPCRWQRPELPCPIVIGESTAP